MTRIRAAWRASAASTSSPLKTLGISAFHRNAAAALVIDGEVASAVEEERFTRKLGEARFPIRAAQFCLGQAGISAVDLDSVVFYQKPLRRFERTLASLLGAFPASARCFSKDMFLWLGDRLWLKGRIAGELGVKPERVEFCSHHQSHASAAFFPSSFDDAAVLIVDGAGEWATTSIWRGTGDSLEARGQLQFPNSLGLVYSALTQYLGFEPEKDEHKVEALAAWGRPRFADELFGLVRLGPGGLVSIEQGPFRFRFDSELLFGEELVTLLGPARIPGGPLELEGDQRRFADIAASLQHVVEEALLHLARHAHEQVPSANLCMGGSLALNAHAMSRLHRDGPFENLFVEPLAHDAGAALGAALFASAAHGDARRPGSGVFHMGDHVRLVAEEHEELIAFSSEGGLEERVADALAAGQLVGWVRGRMTWSPHGSGCRSLFADACRASSREQLNGRVVRRDTFLPLRAVVTAEGAEALFELPTGADAPLRHGQLAVRVLDSARDRVPAVVHEDGTALVQVVDSETNPGLHRLLLAVEARSGLPLPGGDGSGRARRSTGPRCTGSSSALRTNRSRPARPRRSLARARC